MGSPNPIPNSTFYSWSIAEAVGDTKAVDSTMYCTHSILLASRDHREQDRAHQKTISCDRCCQLIDRKTAAPNFQVINTAAPTSRVHHIIVDVCLFCVTSVSFYYMYLVLLFYFRAAVELLYEYILNYGSDRIQQIFSPPQTEDDTFFGTFCEYCSTCSAWRGTSGPNEPTSPKARRHNPTSAAKKIFLSTVRPGPVLHKRPRRPDPSC